MNNHQHSSRDDHFLSSQPTRPQEKGLEHSGSFASIKQMVKDAYVRHASDIHIRVAQVPRFRIQGEMVVASDYA